VRASNVVEDARDSAPPRPSRQAFGWLGAGLLVGAGFTVLMLGVDPAPEATTSTVNSVEGTRVVTVDGIGEVIPGFPDGLLAAKRSDGQSLQLVIWPERGEPSERSVPVGVSSPPDPVAFDVAGRLLATMLPVPGEVGGVLYAGIPEAAHIVSLDVTGYGWHDSSPSLLAYTTSTDGETSLWVTRGNLAESELVAQAVGIDGGLTAWGDWGYAVQAGEDVALFTGSEITTVARGRVLDSHSTGWLAVDDGELLLLESGGGIREIGEMTAAPMLAAGFSPDGARIALLSVEGLHLVSLEEPVVSTPVTARPGVGQVVWSSDGRYVLYPGLRGIIVVDAGDGTMRELMPEDIFTGLGVFNFDEP